MTGVGDLFSKLQPVTENRSTLSLSAGRCGAAAPQKGSAETCRLGRRGRLSPQGLFRDGDASTASAACALGFRSSDIAKALAGSASRGWSSEILRSSQAMRWSRRKRTSATPV